ncbi:MAG: hypothetical protein ACI9WU_001322 [Myxococcota bacterium]|jgi:hypothetical protein
MRTTTRFGVVLSALLTLVGGCAQSPDTIPYNVSNAGVTPQDKPVSPDNSDGDAVLSAHELDRVQLRDHRFVVGTEGIHAVNPIHGLVLNATADGVQITDSAETWSFGYQLRSVGRKGAMVPVSSEAPVVASCPNPSLCDERIAFRSDAVVAWYANTAHGFQQGFDLQSAPSGQGPLVIEGRFETDLKASDKDSSALVFERDGQTRFAVSAVMVRDADGQQLPASLVMSDTHMRLVVDDSTAHYPIMVDPDMGSCPSNWCSDGDPSTQDICNDNGQSCANLFIDTYEGTPCAWGAFCCSALDGQYHADCSDADPSGLECPASWCNDGDASTIDTCTGYLPSQGTKTCTNAFDPTFEGQPCAWGAFCCSDKDGQFHADCGGAPTTGLDCPSGWCNDGDPSTIDTCSNYVPSAGTKDCSYVFDPTYDGEPCWWGQYCCELDWQYHATCPATPALICTEAPGPAAQVDGFAPGNLQYLASYTGPSTGAAGRALMVRRAAGTTEVTLTVHGLDPSTQYMAHVHTDTCANDAGGHYMEDAAGAVDNVNEIWPTTVTDGNGNGIGVASHAFLAREDARSVVIHDTANAVSGSGSKMLCADLEPIDLVATSGEYKALGSLTVFADYQAEFAGLSTGISWLTRKAFGGSEVQVQWSGLRPMAFVYPAHVHNQPCAVMSGGAHYKLETCIDETIAANEINVHAVVQNSAGFGISFAVPSYIPRADAQSVVLHDCLDEFGVPVDAGSADMLSVVCASAPRIACVDFEYVLAP